MKEVQTEHTKLPQENTDKTQTELPREKCRWNCQEYTDRTTTRERRRNCHERTQTKLQRENTYGTATCLKEVQTELPEKTQTELPQGNTDETQMELPRKNADETAMREHKRNCHERTQMELPRENTNRTATREQKQNCDERTQTELPRKLYDFFMRIGVHQDTVTTTNSIPQPIASYEPTINNTRSHANINGKVSLPQVNAPQELLDIFLDPSAEGNHFRKYIRGYNHVFSFTSCGVHIDEQLASASHGIYIFRAQGSMYHSIGGFHPDQGARPRFLQLYIYDTDHELQNRMLENTQLHESLVLKLQQLLHRYNPFIHVFHQHAQRLDVHECSLVIRERPANQPQYSLPTASQVAAIIVGDDIETMVRGRDIKVQTHAGNLRRIQEFVGYYVPLQYPLLFPFGTHGWDINTRTQRGNKVSCRTYYSYMLQVQTPIFVTSFIDFRKLRWVRQRQKELRAELYQGLQDALHTGENNAENVGRRTILPSLFVGSRRDMTQRYEDGMAIVLKEGKPDIFLTMTCNPSWSEIASELSPTQTPQDRPDLTTRIFRAKFEQLKQDVITKGVLGKVKSYIYVTEFQKKGLPHVHMLLILENNDKLSDPDQYDSLV
ncbi:uncharacterized protein LOC130949897 [Arachis stenosperma]|uniref:uncharacterized protein LOC130949897 n=1 Tax=Arachis stenosperma TaxID=217475 RepID=UPI0025AC821E|nr:uncharacterized protein LOC130949897 [Arachis stenosperma]